MKKLVNLCLFVCLLTSCNSEDLPQQKSDFTLKAMYKDVIYTVECKHAGDSIIYLDKEFSDLYNNEISKITDLVTISHEDGVIEFCTNEKEFLQKYKLSFLNESDVKSIGKQITKHNDARPLMSSTVDNLSSAGKAQFNDDKNFQDRACFLDINYVSMINIPRLKDFNNFNDKISSLKITNTMPGGMIVNTTFFKYANTSKLRVVFIGYEDSDYKKATLYCVTKCGEVHIDSDLKNIPLGGRNWNDKISAVVFRIATAGLFPGHDGKN